MMVATNSSHAYIGSCYNLLHVSHSYMMPAIDFFFFFLHSIRSGSSLMPAIRQFIYACFLDGRPKQGQASLWHSGPPRRRLRVRPSPRCRGSIRRHRRPLRARWGYWSQSPLQLALARHTGLPWHASSSLRLSNYLAVGRCRSSWTNQCSTAVQRNATQRQAVEGERPSRAGTGRRAHRPDRVP